jgi:hypothetical protein
MLLRESCMSLSSNYSWFIHSAFYCHLRPLVFPFLGRDTVLLSALFSDPVSFFLFLRETKFHTRTKEQVNWLLCVGDLANGLFALCRHWHFWWGDMYLITWLTAWLSSFFVKQLLGFSLFFGLNEHFIDLLFLWLSTGGKESNFLRPFGEIFGTTWPSQIVMTGDETFVLHYGQETKCWSILGKGPESLWIKDRECLNLANVSFCIRGIIYCESVPPTIRHSDLK